MGTLVKMLSCASLFWGVCQGRLVSVPAGPLTRVKGQSVSISCTVTDYEGPREQDFDWLALADPEPVQVISTFDSSFSDASFRQRVASGDISIERLADNKVELTIKAAAVTDNGVYRCRTPSTDKSVTGNYEADVQLRVIPDSLVVTSDIPWPVVTEGGSVDLYCNASWDSIAGTQLSFTWSVKKGSSLLEELLTFGPEGTVSVLGSSAQRYANGGFRLDLHHRGSCGLVLTGVLPTDQGMYVCTVGEWTREVGGAWYRLQEKSVDLGQVAVTPTAQSLDVSIQDNTTLSLGDTLALTCIVTAEDPTTLGLEVTWLLNGTHVLAHMGHDGVVTNSSDLVGVRRVGEGDFRLVVPSVEKSSSGLYSCRVRAWVRQSRGGWYQAAEKTSNEVQVVVVQLDTDFSAVASALVTPQLSGDPTELECRVTNVSHLLDRRLGASWLYSPSLATTVTVASLDAAGVLVPGPQHRGRLEASLITLTRDDPHAFKLRLCQTSEADAGSYACVITAWSPARQGGWEAVVVRQTPALRVGFANKNPTINVVARRVREARSSGATFEMSCQVVAKNLRDAGFSVAVLIQTEIGGPSRRIISLSPSSVLRLEDWSEPGRQDSVTLARSGPAEFRFRLQGVQVSDRGFYTCEVAAWTKQPGEEDWTKAVSGESNKVQISFEHTGPSFDVSLSSGTIGLYPWETAKVACLMSVSGTPPNADDIVYEMRWYITRLRGSDHPTLLASMDRWGVVRKTPRNDSSDCSLERTGPRSYILNIHSVQDSDTGEYHCIATPWIRSPASGTWSKAPDVTSTRVFINVKFAFWDSMKMPLLYGVCASVAMGIFSLLLGLICTQCCFRNAAYKPRVNNKLMELDMD
ncbi:prostaglandin F2 receptor negative regulator [Denticeps clupeoides]|uniref:prostaglandin F2 receptor negative regulator n=1 Tax=Denticeps clupeoides TaxID=299321 RepID=UPI0010A3D53B|nr:prostaglandin F2 receptor negative regulator-like [Denticeps clupeoides]